MKQFTASFQDTDLIINSVVANVTDTLVKDGEKIMQVFYVSAKSSVEETKPYLSPSALPQPNKCIWYKYHYLHSLNVHMNFLKNVQNDKNSTLLPVSVLKILNPKGVRDLSGFYIRSEHLPTK